MAEGIDDKRAQAVGEFLIAWSRLRDYPEDRARLLRQAATEAGFCLLTSEQEREQTREMYRLRNIVGPAGRPGW